MTLSSRSRAASGVLLLLLATFLGQPRAADDGSESPRPFVRAWRVVLKGQEATAMSQGQEGLTPDSADLSESELDALERRLLPLLAADLKAIRVAELPSNYYRQYAAARLGTFHVILIHGVHRGIVESAVGGAASPMRWRHQKIDKKDGGSGIWDAMYIIERRDFAPLKKPGQPTRVVAFHGLA